MKKHTKVTAILLSLLITVMLVIPTVSVSAADSSSDGVILLGDADLDGSVDIFDATHIQRYLAGMTNLSDEAQLAADVDGNGDVEIFDVTYIQRWLADFTVEYALGEPVGTATDPTDTPTEAPTQAATEAATEAPTQAVTEPTEVTGDEWKENTGTITLSDSGITVTGEGIYVVGNVVIITEGGDWEVTGTCSDGMIYVYTGDEKDVNDKVKLRLNGMSLTNPDGPAIYFDRCKKAFITIESGTTNTVSDGASYTKAVEEYTVDGVTYSIDASAAKGAIHTDDTLEIKGKGTLIVSGNYKHGIATDDDISIENGVIKITSVKDGIHANDDITLNGKNVEITIDTQSDGLDSEGTLNLELVKSLTVTGAGKAIKADGDITVTDGTYTADTTDDCINGNAAVTITGGTFNLASGDDGITAVTDLVITGGTVKITQSGGKGIKNDGDINISGGSITVNSTDDCINGNAAVTLTGGTYNLTSGDEAVTAASVLTTENIDLTANTTGKGIKAESDLYVNSGIYLINSGDDSIHCNGNVTIKNGDFTLTSGDDGVHADTTLTIEDGAIDVTKSYEGLEGNDVIINGGTVSVVASDDGINAAGGQDSSSQGGRPGQNPFRPGTSSNNAITINGGYVYVVASGDGVDSNGALNFNGGTVIVQGPSSGGNSPIDADGSVGFNGGTVIALASSNAMWEDLNGKVQNAVYNTNIGNVQKGATVCVTDSSGNVLSALTSKLSGSLGIVYYTDQVSSSSEVKFVSGGTYSDALDSFGYGTGGTVSGGASYSPSTSTSGWGGGQQGPGGRR